MPPAPVGVVLVEFAALLLAIGVCGWLYAHTAGIWRAIAGGTLSVLVAFSVLSSIYLWRWGISRDWVDCTATLGGGIVATMLVTLNAIVIALAWWIAARVSPRSSAAGR